MNATEIAVVVGGIALIAALARYFFGPRTAVGAQLEGGRQVVDITVRGGYSPNLVRIEAGKPVRLRFDRQENSDCSARVVFPDLRKSASLAAFGTTVLDLDITEPGEYSWACGMNMLHGTLIAEAPDGGQAVPGAAPEERETARAVGVGPRLDSGPARQHAQYALPGALRSLPTDVTRAETELRAVPGVESAQVNVGMERVAVTFDPELVTAEALTRAVAEATGLPARLRTEPGSADTEDAEAADRKAEVRDLTIRVGLGALLTLPVLYASMVMGFAGEQYVPDLLESRWVQLLLTLPVFLWIGWPIHSTGWRALRNRSAEMNSLIALGTLAAFSYSLVATVVPGVLPEGVREVYYEVVSFIVTVILLGRLVEARARAGTGDAIRALIGLVPATARVVRGELEVEASEELGGARFEVTLPPGL